MDHDEARYSLSEYVMGQLPSEQAAALERLLAQDEELRQLEQFLRWLQPLLVEMKDQLPGGHPTGEELVSAALDKVDFTGDRGDREPWVRDHLKDCAECRQLVDRVKAADSDLRKTDAPAGPGSRTKPRLAMAAILALVLISSGIWMTRPNHQGGPDLQVAAVHLAGVSRGQTGTAEVSPSAGGQLPPLVLECDPWVGRASADDFLLEVRLVARESRQVLHRWQVSARAAFDLERAGLLIDTETQAPPPGTYNIEVRDETGAVIFQTGFDLLPR